MIETVALLRECQRALEDAAAVSVTESDRLYRRDLAWQCGGLAALIAAREAARN